MSRRRLPPLLLLEALLGGLLAAAAIGLLVITVRGAETERAHRVRQRLADRVLEVQVNKAAAGLLAAEGSDQVGELEVRWKPGPADGAPCPRVHIELRDPADPGFHRDVDALRCP